MSVACENCSWGHFGPKSPICTSRGRQVAAFGLHRKSLFLGQFLLGQGQGRGQAGAISGEKALLKTFPLKTCLQPKLAILKPETTAIFVDFAFVALQARFSTQKHPKIPLFLYLCGYLFGGWPKNLRSGPICGSDRPETAPNRKFRQKLP